MLKRFLNSTAVFAPPGEGGAPDDPDLEREDDGQEPDETLEADEEAGDAGAEDGEGQDEEGEEQEIDAGPARKPSRAQSRIQTLTTSAREAKEKADRLEREVLELRQAHQARERQAQQESPEARASRRALMAPEEVMREDLRESEARTQNALQQLLSQQREENDVRAYKDLLRENPKYSKYADEVERVRKEQAANGSFVPREVLLDLAIGRAARAAARSGAPTKQGKEAQRRVEAQRTKPPGGKGDVTGQRGRQGDSLEKRLENVQI